MMAKGGRPKNGASNETVTKQSSATIQSFIKSLWEKFKKHPKLPLAVRKWLLFSVFYTIIAVPTAVIYDLIRGFRFDQLKFDWVPDILLVTFAVSVNVLSLVEDKKVALSEDDEFKYSHLPYLMMIITFCIYSFIYKDQNIATYIIFIILAISVAILIVNIRMGINVIKKSSKDQKSRKGGIDL